MTSCWGYRVGAKKDDPVAVAWETRAKNLLKAELRRRGLGYADLAKNLATLEISETERNLTNKISRGSFTAAFLLQCLVAIGVRDLHLD